MIDTVWQNFLKIVREEVGSRVVETWFKAVKLVQWDAYEKVTYLQAPNNFVEKWILQHYKDVFVRHLARLLNEESVSIHFVAEDFLTKRVMCKEAPTAASTQAETNDTLYAPAKALVAKDSTKKSLPLKLHNRVRGDLNENYTFDTFVIGSNNSLAFSAAKAAAEQIGELYNPLFIYGGSGLGKTHLLHAVGNQVKSLHKKAVILYQPADRFVHEFINAIRFNKIYQFETRYKDIDVLLIDDIQFISNKEQTQEFFFHIFNTLHQTNKQIVCTSDSMPRDIIGLAKRMRSRLEGGLMADIQAPSLETMIAILQKKADYHGQVLPLEVAQYIANQGCTNVRELEGMLIRVTAYSSLMQEPLTVELAQKVLISPSTTKKEVLSPHTIAKIVAHRFGYSLPELRSSKRHKEVARVRHIAMYFMKELTDSSLREISLFFGRKDHSTVLHAYEKIKRHEQHDTLFAQELRDIGQLF